MEILTVLTQFVVTAERSAESRVRDEIALIRVFLRDNFIQGGSHYLKTPDHLTFWTVLKRPYVQGRDMAMDPAMEKEITSRLYRIDESVIVDRFERIVHVIDLDAPCAGV